MAIIKQRREKKLPNESDVLKHYLVELIELGVVDYKDQQYALTDMVVEMLERENEKDNFRHEKGFWGTKEGFYIVLDTYRKVRPRFEVKSEYRID